MNKRDYTSGYKWVTRSLFNGRVIYRPVSILAADLVYEPGKVTVPRDGDGPLTVFQSLLDALTWITLWQINDPDRGNMCWFHGGWSDVAEYLRNHPKARLGGQLELWRCKYLEVRTPRNVHGWKVWRNTPCNKNGAAPARSGQTKVWIPPGTRYAGAVILIEPVNLDQLARNA